MTNIFDHRDNSSLDLSPYADFFRKHSRIDFCALASCETMEEMINALKGSEFYAPLSKILEHEAPLLFDYGMALICTILPRSGMYAKNFSPATIWRRSQRPTEKNSILLNLQFIQRSRRFFNMEPATIYALLIPMTYKLKKEEITALVEAPTMEEAKNVFSRTYYGRKYSHLTVANLEEFYNYMLRDILEKEARKDPFSVAMIYSYLYHKEHEVNRLTIAIECVRYGVHSDEAMRFVRNN